MKKRKDRYPGIYKIWLKKMKELRSEQMKKTVKVYTEEEKRALEQEYREKGLI